MSKFTESQVEDAALEWLTGLGYAVRRVHSWMVPHASRRLGVISTPWVLRCGSTLIGLSLAAVSLGLEWLSVLVMVAICQRDG